MPEDNKSNELVPQNSNLENKITLGQNSISSINLDGLPAETQIELRKKHAEGLLELEKKALESAIDTMTIQKRMHDMNAQVNSTAPDLAVTVTGSYTDKLGRTEVIVGNTKKAHLGKLDRSQKGEGDNTVLFVVIGVVGVIILALIMGG
jgi:hypothetical protein